MLVELDYCKEYRRYPLQPRSLPAPKHWYTMGFVIHILVGFLVFVCSSVLSFFLFSDGRISMLVGYRRYSISSNLEPPST